MNLKEWLTRFAIITATAAATNATSTPKPSAIEEPKPVVLQVKLTEQDTKTSRSFYCVSQDEIERLRNQYDSQVVPK